MAAIITRALRGRLCARHLIGSIIALLVLLLAAAPPAVAQDQDASEPLPFGKRKVRDLVVGRLEAMTGRKMTIDGDIQIHLSWKPTVRIEKVRVANAQWGRAPDLLRLDALEVELDMRALLKSRVHMPRLTLVRPTLFLEVSEQGEANWALGGPRQTIVESVAAPQGKPGKLPAIDRLVVVRGEIRFLDQGAPSPDWIQGHIDQAGGRLNDDGVDIAASGRLGSEPFTVVLRTAALDLLRRGDRPRPVHLIATAGNASFEVDGTAVAPFALRGFDLALQARGGGFDELPLLAGLPESPPFKLSAKLLGDSGHWRLKGLDASVGQSSMTGTLALDQTGERPEVSAELSARSLAVGELLGLLPQQHTSKPPADDQGIDLSVLNALNADVSLTAERVFYDQIRLKQVRADLRLQDGELQLEPLAAAAPGGGRVAARFTLRPAPVRARGRLELTEVDLSRLLGGGGGAPPGIIAGTIALSLPPAQGAAPGDSTLEPAAALARLRVEEGRFVYREPRRATHVVVRVTTGSSSADDQSGPQLRADGRFRGADVAADLTADPLSELVAAGPYAVRGDVRLAGSDLSGRVQVDAGGTSPRIDAELTSETLDLTALPPLAGQAPPAAAAGPDSGGPPELPDWVATRDVRLDFQAGRIITEGATVDGLALETRLVDGRLRLAPLKLVYRQPENTRLDIRLRPAHPGAGTMQRIVGTLQGRLQGRPISAALRADGWVDLTGAGAPGDWQLRLSSGRTDISAAGTLRDLLTPATLTAQVTANAPDTSGLADLIGVPLPNLPPYAVDLRLRRDGQRLVLDHLQATAGVSDLSGRIEADLAPTPPDVNIDLTSDRLDYDDLTKLLADVAPKAPARLFSQEPLHLARLGRKVQGRLRYRARTIIASQVPLDDLRLDATLRDGKIELSPLEFGVGGGRVDLDLDLATAAVPPKAELSGEVARVDLRQVLNPFGITDRSVGIVGGRLQVWMRGDSIAALAGSTDGGLFLVMTGGMLQQLLVELASLDVGGALLALLNEHRVPIDCAYLNLHSRDGRAQVANLTVDTSDTLFVGGGDIDLDRERLDLVIEARPKDVGVPAFSSPLRLYGHLSHPRLGVVSEELLARTALAVGLAAVQPLAGLLPLIEPGGHSGSPYCNGLMQELREARRQ